MDRFFGVGNTTCPADSSTGYVKGRNYWHRDNNLYDAYTYAWDGDGNRGARQGQHAQSGRPAPRQPVPRDRTTRSRAAGRGRIRSPASRASTSPGSAGPTAAASRAGSATRARAGTTATSTTATAASRHPDLDYSGNTFYIWGHFVKDVVPTASVSGTTGVLCKPLISFMPCVAVLVE